MSMLLLGGSRHGRVFLELKNGARLAFFRLQHVYEQVLIVL